MKTQKIIPPEDLVPMDLFEDDFSFRIDLAYTRPDNLLFGEVIYPENTRLWLHSDLAKIVLLAAKALESQDLRLVLYDGLRTVNAQECMLETERVKDNPHWLEEPRMLSTPGAGGHPRGMAIDVDLETSDGTPLDMGTPFDDLTEAAHREYPHPEHIQSNREILDRAMMEAAEKLTLELLPLPQEWWDYRLPPNIYDQYTPLRDEDLKALPDEEYENLKQILTAEIEALPAQN